MTRNYEKFNRNKPHTVYILWKMFKTQPTGPCIMGIWRSKEVAMKHAKDCGIDSCDYAIQAIPFYPAKEKVT